MKHFLMAFAPAGVIAIPIILFTMAVMVIPTNPDIPRYFSPQQKEQALLDYQIKDRQAKRAWVIIAAVVTTGAIIFFLPTSIAALRGAPSYLGILLVNLIGGPFLLGWLAALIWSFVDRRAEPAVVQNIYQSSPPTGTS
jgi:hypothetical protein